MIIKTGICSYKKAHINTLPCQWIAVGYTQPTLLWHILQFNPTTFIILLRLPYHALPPKYLKELFQATIQHLQEVQQLLRAPMHFFYHYHLFIEETNKDTVINALQTITTELYLWKS